MAIHAIVEQPARSGDKRSATRWRIRLEMPGTPGDDGVKVVIHDLSADGMLIETRSKLKIGESVAVSLPETGKVIAHVVWQNEPLFGCRFDQPLPQAVVSAVRLRNPTRQTANPAGDPSGTHAMEGLPERLHRLRQEHGLSRTALAERTGFSKPTIWGWETGRTTPRNENLRILAGIFSLTEQQLLFGEENPPRPQLQPAGPQTQAQLLNSIVDQSKTQIAQAAGVPESQVHIHIAF